MNSSRAGYREAPHTADVALEVWAQDLPELFEQAARGLFGLVAATEPGAPDQVERRVSLVAPDWETLLVDWLNELLALSDEHQEAFVTFDVELSEPGRLSAHILGTRAYSPRRAIKAATFHGLEIRRGPNGYRTVIVFDV